MTVKCCHRGCEASSEYQAVLIIPCRQHGMDGLQQVPVPCDLPIFTCGAHKDALKVSEIVTDDGWTKMSALLYDNGFIPPKAWGECWFAFNELREVP